ncbi:MAG: hypothetical protein SXV54_02620 [Chloroflexota bacterium]|nr:hypothetical protein [Chloroflexota bacterium]
MQTVECRRAIEQLSAYVENSDLDRAKVEAAIHHVSVCPHCEHRMAHLLRALTTDEEDHLACQECQALLPDYLQAEADGQAEGAQWRPVALHLETCPHCSAEYTALLELIELAYGERGEEPSHYPVPELPFLHREKKRQPRPAGVPWRLDELGRLIIELSDELVRAFRLPIYQPAYATPTLKSKQSSKTLCHFSLKEAVDDLEVTVTAEEMRADPTRCTVIVEANIPSQGGWPHLGDTEVTLKRDKQKLETQWTDAFGKAVFEGIATSDLAHLVFEITPCA